jgi:uncharacterized protein YdhG (YjbR/CyaY superfamily)
MEINQVSFKSIDEYIALFPEEIQLKLQEIRAAIHAAAPEAEERISYRMPAFAQKGILVYFAAWKDHIGFYPTSSGTQAFRQELSAYEYSKGTIKFPLEKPLPLDLISRIVKFRVAENLKKAKEKSSQKKSHPLKPLNG